MSDAEVFLMFMGLEVAALARFEDLISKRAWLIAYDGPPVAVQAIEEELVAFDAFRPTAWWSV